MHKLNLPDYEHHLRNANGVTEIFDAIRRKYVVLTPEEWVRQNFVCYLINEKQFPQGLIHVEASLMFNTMQRRSDVVVYNRNGKPLLAVECKAATVKISQDVFNQLVRYNMVLQVPYLIVTNGLQHYCSKVDFENNRCTFLKDIPNYDSLIK